METVALKLFQIQNAGQDVLVLIITEVINLSLLIPEQSAIKTIDSHDMRQ